MDRAGTAAIDAQAQAILRDNDRGGYTVPTAGLYPYQWNWDSMFVSLGFATFDEPRAWQEVNTLFEAQWPGGLVPHIVFRHDDPGYFPGPSVWGVDKGTEDGGLPFPTSGISQPPVAATIIRDLHRTATDRQAADDHARALLPKLDAWHQWWQRARDPDGLGIAAITHPWESGRDNLPDWDAPGAAIDTSSVGEYERRDTARVDAAMRPKKADYDRYLALVQFGRERNWDDARIAAENPFFVADVGVTAILLRAERDLAALAEALGETEIATRAATRVEHMESGFERLWNPAADAFCSLDLRTGKHANAATAATFLCFYAGAGTPDQRTAMLDLLDEWSGYVVYMVPSFDPRDRRFDAMRYWRGPVWAMFNQLIARGLAEQGEAEMALKIRRDTATLIRESGFAEYFGPNDGAPAGGDAFSWTAAMWLAWLSPSAGSRT